MGINSAKRVFHIMKQTSLKFKEYFSRFSRIDSLAIRLLFVVTIALNSCGKDNSFSNSEQLSGTWYGTHYYNNPVGGTKFQYLTLSLQPDHRGSLEYESPSSFSVAYFKWSVSSGYVECKGAYANSYGESTAEFSLKLRIENDRLQPLGQFSMFILTKDNSVMTDGNGNEIENPEDRINRLENTWVSTDGMSVIRFSNNDEYEEYILTKPFDRTYFSYKRGKYQYFPYTNRLSIDVDFWDIEEFTNRTIVIKKDNIRKSYTLGDKSDIPVTLDLNGYLCAGYNWIDKNGKYSFCFSNGVVIYSENSFKNYGSSRDITLVASGTYSISGNTVKCEFTSVGWDYGDNGTANYFPEWKFGQNCVKYYKMSVSVVGRLTVEMPNGTIVYFEKK